jgi:hypothetical protein
MFSSMHPRPADAVQDLQAQRDTLNGQLLRASEPERLRIREQLVRVENQIIGQVARLPNPVNWNSVAMWASLIMTPIVFGLHRPHMAWLYTKHLSFVKRHLGSAKPQLRRPSV